MALSNIQVDEAAFWKQQAQIHEQQLDLERAARIRAENQLKDLLDAKEQVKQAVADVVTLECNLSDQRKCTSVELDLLHQGGKDSYLEKSAKRCNQLGMHCQFQQLQNYKWILSTACEAEINNLIWMCKAEDAKKNIDDLVADLKDKLENTTNLPFNLKKHYQMVLAGC